MRLVVLATLIAWPISWWLMNTWLEGFAFRVEINLWIFLMSGFFAILVAMITVASQALKAAVSNPTKSLKLE
jgi:putative ABC transport system permease protein